MDAWARDIGGDTIILQDDHEDVYDLYRVDDFRPQYIVLDRDMTIVYKGSRPNSKEEAEDEVLSLLQ